MALEKIIKLRGRAVPVVGDDIDTDRIIPARFMKCVTFDGLGEFLFGDARSQAKELGKTHPLDDHRFAGATIFVSGANFGCGSSREHAPQALYRWGIRGIVAVNFAEIFFGNCTTLGVPCFSLPREEIAKLAAAIEADPQLEVELDVEAQEVRYGNQTAKASVRESARNGLINGRWDPIGELLDGTAKVTEVAAGLPYIAR
jgi:3-isopropylmalate/(R)-2-methylmalate dehydratase small subunit